MTDEKWDDLIYMVQEKFGIEERGTEPILERDEADHDVRRGEREFLIFRTPEGRMRVERLSRPVILEKKFHYHKGSAGQAQVEYVYSPTEKSHSIEAFRENAGEWEPIDTSIPFGR